MLSKGSIVRIKTIDGERLVMITNKLATWRGETVSKLYMDYYVSPFPEDDSSISYCNEEDICDVIFEGYDDGYEEKRNLEIQKIIDENQLQKAKTVDEVLDAIGKDDALLKEAGYKLPNGSIVKLKGDDELTIIASSYVMREDREGNVYYFDYIGYNYEGINDFDNESYLFNDENIETIIFEGYDDDQQLEKSINVKEYLEKEGIYNISISAYKERCKNQKKQETQIQPEKKSVKNMLSNIINNKK